MLPTLTAPPPPTLTLPTPSLYTFSEPDAVRLAVLRAAEGAELPVPGPVMVLGHNPTLEGALHRLCGSGWEVRRPAAAQAYSCTLRTAGLAVPVQAPSG